MRTGGGCDSMTRICTGEVCVRFPAALFAGALLHAPAGFVVSLGPAGAAALLYPLKPRLTRSSKYASCCSRMGWRILSEPHD